jgi:phosphoglycerate dehydrogenase-like enzyme|tara:strand:- start:1370 stop:1639 length:270 start_codon:yes stop_codon:yes gene_type:complete
MLLFKKVQFWNRIEHKGVALPAHYGHTLPAKQAQNVPNPEAIVSSVVRVDPRVLAEIDRKKPIGVTRTGWVNLLLQKAIASEPEPLVRD